MFHKLKVLTLLQLSEKINLKSDASALKKLLIVVKQIAAMLISFGIFALLFWVIIDQVFHLGGSQELFTTSLVLLQVISLISCTIVLSSFLYTSKDNMILLTYPVKHIYVYISKILVTYIIELKRSLTFTLPLFLAYGVIVKEVMSVNYIVSAVIFSVILPLLPVLLGAIVSIPFVYVTRVFKESSLIKFAFTILACAGVIVGLVFLIKALPDDISLIGENAKFQKALSAFCISINKFGLYCNFIGGAMYAKEASDILINDGLFLASLVVTAVISILISLPCFYRLASSASENATQKKHKAVNVSHKSTFFTFMRKDFLLSIRNIGNFASDYVFLFAMPFVLIIFVAILVRIPRLDTVGENMIYGFTGMVSMFMLAASNTASATAISSEGSEFALIKTAPGKTSNIIWSKMLVNLFISIITLTATFVLLTAIFGGSTFKVNNIETTIDVGKLWIVFGYNALLDIGLLLWSIQLDVLHPKLREFANSANKSEIKNSGTSVLIGTITAIISSIILVVIFYINTPTLMAIIILGGVALIFDGLRFFFLKEYAKAYFDDIQF